MNEMMDMVAASVIAVARSFSIQVSETELVQELKLWNYSEKTEKVRKRYENVVNYIKEPVFLNVFYLALAQYFYPPIYNILREYTGQGVTIHLALLLEDKLSFGNEIEFSVSEMKDSFEKLKKILKLEKEIENFLYSEFYADERLVMYLMGNDDMPTLLRNICKLSTDEGYDNIREESLDTGIEELLQKSVSEGKRMVIHIIGRSEISGSGIVRGACKKLGIRLLTVDFQALIRDSKEREILYQKEINREILFYQGCICFIVNNKNVEENQNIDGFLESWICSCEEIIQKPICVITDDSTEITPKYNIPIFKYVLNENYKKDTVYLWEKAAHKYSAFLCEGREKEYREKGLQRIKSSYSLQDIKISEKQKNKLIQLSSYIKYNYQVFEQWNMKEKYPYGRNLTVLFSGPPGTGKTMTAGALSRELDMPLYKADLSSVMDKYIGETEKRLEKIFSICERSNVILFFDEADVLFGKRSEIRDARDKFANSSVSYILQRMEQYEGMIILATNLKNNIDNAFLRRIKYVISFHMPDAETRRQIWKSGFTEEIPTENIDIEFLGDNVELSGGYIKNIIINAAFNAAGEGSPVTMKHIIQSVENEYEKLGILISDGSFGKYSEYLTGVEREDKDYGIVYSNKQY